MGGNNMYIAVAANPSCHATARAIDAATVTPPRNGIDRTQWRRQGNDERAGGGGEGPPAPQRGGHLSTCGPSKQPQPLLLSDRAQTQRHGDNEHGGVATGRVRRNAAGTTRRRAVLKNIKI